jgi:hypothetical protein
MIETGHALNLLLRPNRCQIEAARYDDRRLKHYCRAAPNYSATWLRIIIAWKSSK